ncbi:putative N-acetyltransferase YhbS [Chromobacterium violaceum]|uniref:GNAT family N-acetyltransferase n=1 Tax=Chromobacterium violaceum TaxID=536 RepID=UPI003CF7F816
MFTLRPLAETDSIEQLTALLHRAYAQLAAMGLRYTAVDQSAAVTRRRIAGGYCLQAWHGDELVGTVTVHYPRPASPCPQFRQPDGAVLMQFAVDPAWQGQRLGSRLMDAAEDWARRQGYRRIRLDTAEPATHLVERYLKRGYRVEAPLQWPDKAYASVVMVKELEAAAATRTLVCTATN